MWQIPKDLVKIGFALPKDDLMNNGELTIVDKCCLGKEGRKSAMRIIWQRVAEHRPQ